MDIKKIQFSYGDKPLIHELSTTIEKGKITTIIGPNGSGKSTLLNLIIKQLQPKEGQIVVDGKNITTCSYKDIAKMMAIVHQHNTAPEDLTVERLIAYGRTPYQSFWSSKDEEEEEVVAWALKVTKLEGLARKPISQLSGGERQRAWIAMALAQKTDIVVLDEPTTYLDLAHQLDILNLLQKLNKTQKRTIVMVIHELNNAARFADHMVGIKKGRIVCEGTPEEVMTKENLKELFNIDGEIVTDPRHNRPVLITYDKI